jgi:hypothetical protein
MMLELIHDLKNTGLLSKLYKAGLISHKVPKYYDIFLTVKSELEKGSEKMVAYQFAADKYNVCLKTVERAIIFFES